MRHEGQEGRGTATGKIEQGNVRNRAAQSYRRHGAKKAAEANLIARREETGAMRNQADTAMPLADNATLMRFRVPEVLEKVACEGKLNVVLGEKGLADRVVNLL